MAFRPPQHRIDAPALYVAKSDDWDFDRIDRERKEHGEHPVDRYWRGDTRFDLDARETYAGAEVAPRDYLGGDYTVFHLRRLDSESQALCADIHRRHGPISMYRCMVMCGVMKIDNGPEFSIDPATGVLAKRCVDEICATGTLALLIELGQAVDVVSAPLREDEKKV